MDTTTEATTSTLTLTDAQMRVLHYYASPDTRGGYQKINRGVLNRLVALGALRENPYGNGVPRYSVTPTGQAAHDAVYSPARLAAEAQAQARAAKAARDAAQARRDSMDTAAELRTEDMAVVRDLLGDAAPWWVKGTAKPHNDYSGIGGGRSSDITATKLRRYLDAAVARAEAVALAPVLCRDCDTYVPAGWVGSTNAPRCPKTVGYAHRAYTDALQSARDKAAADHG